MLDKAVIALSAKNAVSYAQVRTLQGDSAEIAARHAAKARFRAVLMTAFSFLLALVPLLFADGVGANNRQEKGSAVFTGMLASSFVGVLFVPGLFVVMKRWVEAGH